MKLKTIFSIALSAVLAVGVTSCEDMLRVDSKTYMFDYQNTLDSPVDTVYSVLGVIKKLQKIADRTVILGEIRGDLVALSSHASDDLRELYNYDFSSLKSTNKYDQAVDYYAIINNCNFFIENADTAFTRNQKAILKGEYITMLCYRAWAYLQLAQVYGEVPYFDKPITADNAASGTRMNIKELAQTLLLDFKDEYINYYDRYQPNYGKLGGEDLGDGGKSEQHESKEIMIPIRLILGDLCLWAEKYEQAALYYHDFLLGGATESAYTIGNNCIQWQTNDFLHMRETENYTSNIFGDNGHIAYIPMDADKYSGEVSDLENIFCSTKENDNWYQLTSSRAATAISVRQNYCYHAQASSDNDYEWPAYMADKSSEEEVLYRGDLRLGRVLIKRAAVKEDNEVKSSTIGDEEQTLKKIKSEKIWLYRKDVVYLRLAEALNRCGLPQTAFAVLKTGLCEEIIDSLSQGEKDRAAAKGISAVYSFPKRDFIKSSITWKYENVSVGGTSTESFYCASWKTTDNGNTIGLHSRGCGDAGYDTLYTIGNKLAEMASRNELNGLDLLTDSIRAVEEYLIDEMALETCFEGYRFGDLMRISMHRAADNGYPGHNGFAENEFLAKRVAAREDAVMDDKIDYYRDMNQELYQNLLGNGKDFNKAWFLVLPDMKQIAE